MRIKKKKEFRVFLDKAEAEWIWKKIDEGEGTTPSDVIRTLVRNARRGLLKGVE